MTKDYTFPGGFKFVNRLAETHGDMALVGVVSRLVPVQQCMQLLGNVPTAPHADARNEFVRRAADSARLLQAGLAAVQDAVREVVEHFPDVEDPFSGQGVQGALPPRERDQFRPRVGDIRSAPIDPYELGVSGTEAGDPRRRPPPPAPPPPSPAQQAAAIADREAQRRARDGIDEGMSGGPPRPDTGVNQTFNQVNVPAMYEQPVQAADSYKQDINPPRHEPNETDDGTGPELAQRGSDQGSGLTHAAALAGMRQEPTQADFAVHPLRPDGPSEGPPEGPPGDAPLPEPEGEGPAPDPARGKRKR